MLIRSKKTEHKLPERLGLEPIDPVEPAGLEQGVGEEAGEEPRLDLHDDPVRRYFSEMSRVPLLTREGEVAIGRRLEVAEASEARAGGAAAAGEPRAARPG